MIEIRTAEPKDAEAIRDLHAASIRELCATHYSDEQIAAWAAQLESRRYLRLMESHRFSVAELGAELAGFSILDLARGELNALYVAPPHSRRGVGRALLKQAEELAAAAGIDTLSLNATLNSVPFYEALGCLAGSPTTNTFPGGLELPCMRMSRGLG